MRSIPLRRAFASRPSCPPVLPEALAARGPIVIGATGGSGTRAVARILLEAGIYLGRNLTPAEDALPFGAFSDRWINEFIALGARDPLLREMTEAIEQLVIAHCRGIPPGSTSWGWKEPRSIYLLPFYDAVMPTMRFVHLVRDGRDMVLSENQNQLGKHGAVALGTDLAELESSAVRSMALWSAINLAASDFGETRLQARYTRLRFEDLCGDPVPAIVDLLDFCGIAGDPAKLAGHVAPPDSLGRWRHHPELETLERIGARALERFRYEVAPGRQSES